MYDESAKTPDWMNDPAIPASPIEVALAALHQNINVLEECVNKLRSKASSVIGPAPPMPSGDKGSTVQQQRSKTWHSIDSASERIDLLSAEVRALTSCLET